MGTALRVHCARAAGAGGGAGGGGVGGVGGFMLIRNTSLYITHYIYKYRTTTQTTHTYTYANAPHYVILLVSILGA